MVKGDLYLEARKTLLRRSTMIPHIEDRSDGMNGYTSSFISGARF